MDMRRVNRIVSTIVPLVLFGIVGYASWVFCRLLCVDYLITARKPSRPDLAAGLLTGYGILFVLFIAPYLRTFLSIQLTPGYIELGPKLKDAAHHHGHARRKKTWHLQSKSAARRAQQARDLEKGKGGSASAGTNAGMIPNRGMISSGGMSSEGTRPAHSTSATPGAHGAGTNSAQSVAYTIPHRQPMRPESVMEDQKPGNLRDFWTRDVFVCEADGLPKWCPHCNVWKPDRTHHCSEYGRCVRRMDHICPWVGGVVGETSYKFFVQSVFYGSLFTLYIAVIDGIYMFEQSRESPDGKMNKNFIALFVLSIAFGFFALGMCLSTLNLLLRNISTIENLNVKTREYHLAVYDPNLPPRAPEEDDPVPVDNQQRLWSARPVTQITYPLPKSHVLSDPADLNERLKPRTFRVIRTEPGENPFRLRRMYDNIAEVMGYSLWEWWLPLTRSPVEKRGWSRFNKDLIERALSASKAIQEEV